jgi:hypothetical protein
MKQNSSAAFFQMLKTNTISIFHGAMFALVALMFFCGGCQTESSDNSSRESLTAKLQRSADAQNARARHILEARKALDNGPIGSVVHGYLQALNHSSTASTAAFVSKAGITGENLAQTFGDKLSHKWSFYQFGLTKEDINEAGKKAIGLAKFSLVTGNSSIPVFPLDFEVAFNRVFSEQGYRWSTIMTARTFYLVFEDGAWKIYKVGPCAFINGELAAPDMTQ